MPHPKKKEKHFPPPALPHNSFSALISKFFCSSVYTYKRSKKGVRGGETVLYMGTKNSCLYFFCYACCCGFVAASMRRWCCLLQICTCDMYRICICQSCSRAQLNAIWMHFWIWNSLEYNTFKGNARTRKISKFVEAFSLSYGRLSTRVCVNVWAETRLKVL